MKLTLLLSMLLVSVSVFAERNPHRPPTQYQEYNPPYPDQQQHTEYQDQGGVYYEQHQRYESQNRYSSTRPYSRPSYQPSCQNRCPRSSCRPSCPPPRREVPNCQVVMVDCYDRVIARYDGFLDYPSRACGGALRQCDRDSYGYRRDGARCLQVRR